MCFVNGTGQSLEWRPRLEGTRAAQDPNTLRRGSSLPVYGKTQYTAQDPERIAAHAIGYPQEEKAAPCHAAEKAAHVGQPSRIVCSVLAIANAYSYIPLTPDAPYRAFWTVYGRFCVLAIAATTGRGSATPKK